MNPEIAAAWPSTPVAALACQARLVNQVCLVPLPAPPRLVAGVDVAYDHTRGTLFGTAVVLRLPELSEVAAAAVSGPETFPYIPGLLTFREAPIIIQALQQLPCTPEVIMVDGQGIAHPRGLGLASHLGVLLDRPTLGAAKSRLVGDFDVLGEEGGQAVPLFWRGKQVGWVLRSRRGCRPLYLSPGHRLTLAETLAVARSCMGKYRLLEPVRAAHLLGQRARREAGGENSPGG